MDETKNVGTGMKSNQTFIDENVNEELDIQTMSQFIAQQAERNELTKQRDSIETAQTKMMAMVGTSDGDRDILSQRINEYDLGALKHYLAKDENVEELYKDIDINIDFESEKRAIDFKRDLAIHFKTTEEMLSNIDKEGEELDKATAEFNEQTRDICINISDNLLSYIQYSKEKVLAYEDSKEKTKMLEQLRHIESGYTMEVFSEALDKFPSIIEKAPKELTKVADVNRIGKRYTDKLNRANIKSSLVLFASDIYSNKKSFEEMVLTEDQYTVPDLFIFSLIRYYAMADFNDDCTKKSHSSLIVVLKRLMSGDMVPELREKVVGHIVDYLNKFNK